MSIHCCFRCQPSRSCWIMLRRAWLGSTETLPGGSGCLLSGSTPGLTAAHSSRASRSKLWPLLPYSTGSRMTLPLSGQRHQSDCAAGIWSAAVDCSSTSETPESSCELLAVACAAGGSSGCAVSATGVPWRLVTVVCPAGLVVATSARAAVLATCAFAAAAAACCLAAFLRARLAAALLRWPEAPLGCSSACIKCYPGRLYCSACDYENSWHS